MATDKADRSTWLFEGPEERDAFLRTQRGGGNEWHIERVRANEPVRAGDLYRNRELTGPAADAKQYLNNGWKATRA